MEIISFEKIKKITADCICYVNQKGIEKVINLKECNENWLNYQKRQGKSYVVNFPKYVGQRNVTDDPMFIELFTRPFVRIEFPKDKKSKFDMLKEKLTTLGWATLDLT